MAVSIVLLHKYFRKDIPHKRFLIDWFADIELIARGPGPSRLVPGAGPMDRSRGPGPLAGPTGWAHELGPWAGRGGVLG